MVFWSHWLPTILVLVPLLGVAVIAVLRGNEAARRTALVATLVAFVVSLLVMVPFKWRHGGKEEPHPRGAVRMAAAGRLVLGAEYHVAVDGMSYPFVVLTTLLFPLLCAAGWNDRSNGRAFFATLLALQCALLGFLLSSDFLWMFLCLAAVAVVAWRLLLSDDKGAARRLAFHLSMGLIGVLVAVVTMRAAGGTFDLAHLAKVAESDPSARRAVFAFAVIGFLIWMAAPPFHSWVVAVANRARPPVAIAISLLIPAAGGYGLMRIALTLFPHAAASSWGVFAVLGVAGILYGGLCALAAHEVKSFVAYSATSSIGFVLLAVMFRTPTAYDGAVLLLLGQVLAGAMLLILAAGTKSDASPERTPLWTGFFGVASLAWLVTPVMLGQVIILMATFQFARNGTAHRPAFALAIVASFGLIANGAAAARIVRRAFQAGASPEVREGELPPADVTVLAVLGTVAALLGIVPGVLCFTFTHPAARALLKAP